MLQQDDHLGVRQTIDLIRIEQPHSQDLVLHNTNMLECCVSVEMIMLLLNTNIITTDEFNKQYEYAEMHKFITQYDMQYTLLTKVKSAILLEKLEFI